MNSTPMAIQAEPGSLSFRDLSRKVGVGWSGAGKEGAREGRDRQKWRMWSQLRE